MSTIMKKYNKMLWNIRIENNNYLVHTYLKEILKLLIE